MKPVFGNGNKAQAAMEFLMTYGWAILVVLIVIGALSYFGVLSPATLLPEKCTFPVSVSCTDFSVLGTGGITLVLQNGAGRDMIVKGITASSQALGTGSLSCSCNATAGGVGGVGGVLRNGQSASFTVATVPAGNDVPTCTATPCAFRDTGRDKNRYFINVTYSWVDSPTIPHILPGELLGRKP